MRRWEAGSGETLHARFASRLQPRRLANAAQRAPRLERAAPGRPIALYAHDHHSRWVSPAALRRAGVDATTPDPTGGIVRRDASGEPTGVLHEMAANLVDHAIPEPDPELLAADLHAASADHLGQVSQAGIEALAGLVPIEEALQMAEAQGLDLVEIAPTANPPVCKIIDYKKFLYEKKKKEKEIKAKAAKTVIKEIRFTPNTDEHDFEFKCKHAEKFLDEGAKVKAYVQFKGRAIMFKERGELILLKLAQKLEDKGTLEQMPKLEGRRMIAFLAPKGKK